MRGQQRRGLRPGLGVGDGLVAGFSWLHLMALVVLFYVLYGVRSIRRGQVAAHRAAMLGVAFGGLDVAGGFAVAAPGRILRAAVFGG